MPDMNWQWLIVAGLVIAAAWYAGRNFLAQFFHAEDEAHGCSACQSQAAKNNPLRIRLIQGGKDEASTRTHQPGK